ncbi:MAG: hypothetical protein GXO12_03450, partial [Epsilonproteobacteria bacterium]|nr:hypothetical protein [Campylobacterota bacterium]
SIKRDYSIFIAEDFIDANVKHMYLYYIKKNEKAIMLTNNDLQYSELKKHNLPVKKLFSLQGYFYTALAKKIYLDHFILDYLEYLSPRQITIQLWHGVGLKPIRDRSKFRYSYFVSPSKWTNETNFKKVFKANKFLNYGYPRNDILLKKEDKLDLILCDTNIYNKIQKDKQKHKRVILYMPTFRENGFDMFPLDFKSLNEEMQKMSAKFYVKLHPFVLDKYRDTLKEENYSNVIFYNTVGDVYPILKYVDILVSDYSSIVYDFLILNRPIIFFNYDFEEYVKARKKGLGQDLLFDYDEFSPGAKVKTQELLLEKMKEIIEGKDEYEKERLKIRDKFYDYIEECMSKIYQLSK